MIGNMAINEINPTTIRKWQNNQKIEFKNVSFKYPNSKNYILKNISFTIKNLESIALVGLNDSGKSTLVKLLCGFYEQSSGVILINDKQIKEYDKIKYRDKISVIFQDFKTYDFSISENIIMGENKSDKL